ncbi:Glycosyl hydrolase family 30, TIM-barrel domain,Glycoside hydrolase family 30,Glycosyl hydrolase [Cinara cedri]|uniref:Glucosylceramidase n=1 Tax=Cinara cedri TaxID=506608 RepID=A0A5E4MNX4_9HEMI|nr:Glycosyl hydrolase family 30, TIM-barrel domain,Glycoside hydrolase family 30,Glycosyl hydrolase [Cinara cedri]
MATTTMFLKWIFSFVLIMVTITTVIGINAETVYDCSPRKFTYGTVCVCNATYCDRTPDPEALSTGRYVLYTSSNTGSRFHRFDGMYVQSLDSQWSGDEINVDETTTYQTMHGFGGAFTDSAGINIMSLSPDAQKNLIKSYFADDGIKYNIGRVPIGGTDFSTRKYTYADSGAPDLKDFGLAIEDEKYKIPLIKTAMEMSSQEVKLIGSAWSAPPWMKTNNDYSGIGFLRPSFMEMWAEYHLKFLDAYREKNLKFWALTTGNEPINGIVPVNRFNSMGWTPMSHREWIGRFMGPQLRGSDYNDTLLLAIDDQRIVLPWWMKMLMSDKECAKYIDGVAIHWYLDFIVPVKVLNEVHKEFGDKIIINTEASQGDKPWDFVKVQLGSWTRAENYVNDIIDDLNHWVQGWVEWNLALDKTGGPTWVSNFIDSPIIVDKTADEFYKQPMFYAIGHFSKFISRGSVRIKLTQSSVVKSVGFKRPDGAIVIVLYNRRNKPLNVAIKDPKRGVIGLVLQKQSVNTLLYW